MSAMDVNAIIERVITWVRGVVFAVSVLMLIIAGLRHMLADTPSQAEAAKAMMLRSLIGFAIVILAKPIVRLVESFLGQ